MTQYGTWVSYSGRAGIALAIVLASAAAAAAYAGVRLRLPVPLPRPGRRTRTFMLVAWLVAITAFLLCVSLYALHAARQHLGKAPPADPITPVTVICLGIVWFAIVLMHNSRGGA
jgi:peptidoglycan biosynthesis protein MviN/MurJ (putative lipid II flippase)